jgi:uncharacterized protein (TIGR03435 family)
MTRRFAVPLAISLLSLPATRAQSPTADAPKFDAAAIRLCTNGGLRGGETKQGKGGGGNRSPFGNFSVSPGRLNTGCYPLATTDGTAGLLPRVYGRLGLGRIVPLGSALPISGGPAWVYSNTYDNTYDINAVASGNASEEVMEGPMLQALLEDRFKLKIHRESKDVPVYALTVAKGGSKLTPSQPGSCVIADFTKFPLPPPGPRYCDALIGRRGPNTTIDSAGNTLEEFRRMLTLVMDRPVIDKTGIAGKFDIHIEFAIDQAAPGPVVPPPPGPDTALPGAQPDVLPAPSVFTVVQQELGLRLDPVKGPREFLVIDSIQRPSGN